MAITASEARKNLFPLIEQVNDDRTPVEITSRRGGAVLISRANDLPEGQHSSVQDLLAGVTQCWPALLAEVTRPLRVTAADDAPGEAALSSAAATQILDILIDNARMHGRGAVTVHARDTAVAFDVSDEGDGPDQEAHQLFADRDASPRGGIGLPFARRLAEAERARVTVTSLAPPTFSLVVASSPDRIQDMHGDVGGLGREKSPLDRGHRAKAVRQLR